MSTLQRTLIILACFHVHAQATAQAPARLDPYNLFSNSRCVKNAVKCGVRREGFSQTLVDRSSKQKNTGNHAYNDLQATEASQCGCLDCLITHYV